MPKTKTERVVTCQKDRQKKSSNSNIGDEVEEPAGILQLAVRHSPHLTTAVREAKEIILPMNRTMLTLRPATNCQLPEPDKKSRHHPECITDLTGYHSNVAHKAIVCPQHPTNTSRDDTATPPR